MNPSSTFSIVKSKSFFNKIRNLNEGNSNFFKTSLPFDESLSAVLIKDHQCIEKIKHKQATELQSIIEYEVKKEDIRETNQRKLDLQHELEEKIKAEKIQIANEERYKRRIRELEKHKRDIIEKEKQDIILEERKMRLNKKEIIRKKIFEQKKKESAELSNLKNTMTEHKLVKSFYKIEKKLSKQLEVNKDFFIGL